MRNTKTTYKELLKRASICSVRLDELSIWPKNKFGRFQFYQRLVGQLDAALEKGNISDFLQVNNQHGDCGFALKQMHELVTIFENVLNLLEIQKKTGEDNTIQKLKFVLSGPNFPREETDKNSAARNYQHELLLASRLFDSGYKDIEFQDNPDILVIVNGRRYGIECKRIIGSSEKTIINSVNTAVEQLEKVKENYFAGIVSIDLSVLYEQGSNFLESGTATTADNFVQSELFEQSQFVRQNSSKLIKSASNGLIVSLFASISCVYVLKPTAEMGWVNEVSVCVLDKENVCRAPIFTKDFAKLILCSTERK